MDTRTLGASGPQVSALGLGMMGMSDLYGPADRAESIATIHAALDAGLTLIDTGDWYGMGDNEMLLGDAVRGRDRDSVTISVKFGILRDPGGSVIGIDNRPNSIKNYLSYTLRRLGTDHVDIYRPSRVSPEVGIEEVVGTLAELVQAGYVRHIGLSEVGADTLRRAAAVHPICDVQIEYSLISRGLEAGLLPAARELGVGLTAYGVLSRGLISGHWSKQRAARPDFRSHLPRFSGDNLDRNLALVEQLRRIAEAKGVTVAQLAIAWALSRGPDIVALIGARHRDRLTESLGALDVTLTPDDLAAIESSVPADAVAGTRYDAGQMAILDSERR
jgi:aryl-alcohol dehydrogenase-like predicted oxidoreductase